VGKNAGNRQPGACLVDKGVFTFSVDARRSVGHIVDVSRHISHRLALATRLQSPVDALELVVEAQQALERDLSRSVGRPERDFGEAWQRCVEQRALIAKKLNARVRLSKVRRLLARQGVVVPPWGVWHQCGAAVGEARGAAP
jgi:hypothetical protein